MAKKNEYLKANIWEEITEEDFLSEDNIEDIDVNSYNLDRMVVFFGNISYFRQIPKLVDGLKPVERRALYVMYKKKALETRDVRTKSALISAITMTYHPHGDASIYGAIVGLAQDWIMPFPLVCGTGNFGDTYDSNAYGQMRYTEVAMSKFGYDCFFKDYDEDCVEMIFNSAVGEDEPASLPCRYPVILMNGRFGIAAGGNFSCIPPFNAKEVITYVKKLIKNPNSTMTIYPDFPMGCDIVDDGCNLQKVCDTGVGNITTRAKIEIMEGKKYWELHITNLPWMVNMSSVLEKIAELIKAKKIKIKDVKDVSTQLSNGKKVHTDIHYIVYVDKSHDPYLVRDLLFKHTQLQKVIHVDTKVVLEGFELGENMSIRDLALSWIDTRRGYKRRLYNKKIVKLAADIDFLSILIELLSNDKIMKTVEIVRTSTSEDVYAKLVKMVNLTTFQARRILDLSLKRLTTDAREEYIVQVAKKKEELDACEKALKSPKLIDDIIIDELDELKDLFIDRKSDIIEDAGRVIPNTEHAIIVTKMGYVKKFLYDPKNSKGPVMGALKPGDYPITSILIRNLEKVLFFDSLGRCSAVPVYEIPTTDTSEYGTPLYDVTKMNGEIISIHPYFSETSENIAGEALDTKISLLTLSADGYFKRTELGALREMADLKVSMNSKVSKLRDGDKIVFAQPIMEHGNVILYTKKGKFLAVSADEIPVMSMNSQGLMSVTPDGDDEYLGACVIGQDAEYLAVLTEKGYLKKLELQYMQTSGKRRAKGLETLVTLDSNDNVVFVDTVKEYVKVVTRSDLNIYKVDDIPTLALRAKGKKMVPIPVGTTITRVESL